MKQSHSIDEIRNVWWYSILTSYKTYVKNDTVRDTFHSNKMTFIFMNPYFLKDVITPEPYTKVAYMKEKEYLRESKSSAKEMTRICRMMARFNLRVSSVHENLK